VRTKSSSSFASQRKTKFGKGLGTSGGAPGRHTSQIGKSLSENLANTRLVLTKEAADQHKKPQSFFCTRQVGKRASVMTMNTMRNVLAEWTSGFGCFYYLRSVLSAYGQGDRVKGLVES
jgi:hypothetical protein